MLQQQIFNYKFILLNYYRPGREEKNHFIAKIEEKKNELTNNVNLNKLIVQF